MYLFVIVVLTGQALLTNLGGLIKPFGPFQDKIPGCREKQIQRLNYGNYKGRNRKGGLHYDNCTHSEIGNVI